MQSCFVRVNIVFYKIVFCVVRAVHTFTIGVLWAQRLTYGDQWKGHAMTETRVSDIVYVFLPNSRRE
jgi:hypothetical protein